MAFLQAFTDDSESQIGNRRLFFAGYLNSSRDWALFADAWDEELRAAPSIRFLKTTDAYRLEGEFRGWTAEARDEKLRGLARVIRHFNPLSFDFSVSTSEFRGNLKGVAPRGLADPRFTCTYGIVAGVSQILARSGVDTPVDFFFDEQDGVSADITLFFEHMKEDIPADARALINGNPIYKSDLEFLPLQAADMLAWHMRAHHENPAIHENMLDAVLGAKHFKSEVPIEIIQKWSAQMGALPGTDKMQTKSQWRNLKMAVADAKAAGYRPPHGTRLRNLIFGIRDWLRRR